MLLIQHLRNNISCHLHKSVILTYRNARYRGPLVLRQANWWSRQLQAYSNGCKFRLAQRDSMSRCTSCLTDWEQWWYERTESLNRCVLRWQGNWATVDAAVRSLGELFYHVTAATQNAWSPTVTRCVEGTSRRCLVDDGKPPSTGHVGRSTKTITEDYSSSVMPHCADTDPPEQYYV